TTRRIAAEGKELSSIGSIIGAGPLSFLQPKRQPKSKTPVKINLMFVFILFTVLFIKMGSMPELLIAFMIDVIYIISPFSLTSYLQKTSSTSFCKSKVTGACPPDLPPKGGFY